MKKTRLISIVLSILLVFTALPFTTAAADPVAVEIEGQNTVFVSSFGRIRYGTTNYTAFKNFGDAMAALSATGGGAVIFAGTINLEEYTDIKGRAPVTVIGSDDNTNQNIINFGSLESFDLEGDLIFRNVSIAAADQTADATDATPKKPCIINANGHSLAINGDVTRNYYTVRKDGGNLNIYTPKVSIATSLGGATGTLGIAGGEYENIAAGAYNGNEVSGTAKITVEGASVENLVAGNIGAGTLSGGSFLSIKQPIIPGEEQAVISNLYAGSLGGTVDGNIEIAIGSGTIDKLIVGAASGAKINGNIIVTYESGTISAVEKAGNVSGKTVFVDKTGTANVPASAFDHYVVLKSGSVKSSAGNLVIRNSIGIPATSVTINGKTLTNEQGIYELPAGKSEIVVTGSPDFKVNPAANYVKGYTDGTFGPQKNMTRAEAVTLLSRLIINDSEIVGKLTSNYSDVKSGAWYESYIGFFETLGFFDTFDLTNGKSIKPDTNITRGEFVQLIYEIEKLNGLEKNLNLKKLTDINPDTTYSDAIYYAVSRGYVTGYEDGTFKPLNNITRAEVVTIVNRVLGRNPTGNAGETDFSDISSHWAKGQILAACNPEGTAWTKISDADKEFKLPGKDTKENIIALYEQAPNLTGTAIRDGVDKISEQIIENIVNSENSFEIKGKAYYVSEKNGNDENDGLSPETAWKTLSSLKKAKLYFGDAVLFERGGVYRGQMAVARGVSYGAYGDQSQPKPLIMQSKKNYADPDAWTAVEGHPNVWQLKNAIANAGIVAFDHDIQAYGDYDALYGQMMNIHTFGFETLDDLTEDLQFYNDLDTNKFYLYCEGGNPGTRFKSIEIGEKVNLITGSADNVHLDNLMLKYSGGHGMAGCGNASNRKVTNCVFAWIGGAVLKWRDDGSAVNYGNAVEVYGTINGFHIQDNWMWQIYDTAITHQSWTTEENAIMKNINYTGNLIEHSYWGIEVANTSSTTHSKLIDGVHIAYNVLRKGGDAWGAITRFRTNVSPLYQLYGMTPNNRNELFEYNILDRSTGYLIDVVKESNEVYSKNIYIQKKGLKLGKLKGTGVVADYNSPVYLDRYLGDSDAVVVIAEEWDNK